LPCKNAAKHTEAEAHEPSEAMHRSPRLALCL
jgi:hypothetical protein